MIWYKLNSLCSVLKILKSLWPLVLSHSTEFEFTPVTCLEKLTFQHINFLDRKTLYNGFILMAKCYLLFLSCKLKKQSVGI